MRLRIDKLKYMKGSEDLLFSRILNDLIGQQKNLYTPYSQMADTREKTGA